MQGDNLLDKDGLRSRDVLDGLTGHRFGQETDEVAGMAGFHCHANLAVGLEAADSRPMTRTRVNHHERTALVINRHATWRRNSYQRVVDRPRKRSAVDDQFDFVVEDVGRRLSDVFAVLQSALAHDIEEQNTALPGIDQIFEAGCKEPRKRFAREGRLVGRHARFSHCLQPCIRIALGWSGPLI